MPDTPGHLSLRLRTEGEKTLDFFRDLSSEHWGRTVYSEGSTWKVEHILAHFVSTERGLLALVRNILSGGSGSPHDFDLNAYNERKVARLIETPRHDLMKMFAELREETASVVAGLNEEDLQRRGRHPFLGVVPLVDIIKMIYRHHQIHLRDVRKIISTGGDNKTL